MYLPCVSPENIHGLHYNPLFKQCLQGWRDCSPCLFNRKFAILRLKRHCTAYSTQVTNPMQLHFDISQSRLSVISQLPPHPAVWKHQDQKKRNGSNNRNITRERNFTILNSLYGYGFRSATTVDLIKLQKGAKVPILV